MSRVIYKYSLNVEDFQNLILPLGAEILTIQTQGDQPYIWAAVDPDTRGVWAARIITLTTGAPMPEVGRYLGTYQILKGRFVGHVFLAPE